KKPYTARFTDFMFGAVAFRHLAATASKIARAARTRMVSKVEIGDVLGATPLITIHGSPMPDHALAPRDLA
ncbi:MAG: hypothetical protein WCC13_04870, partial [Methylovirgula sp.]